jgi:hypothetical protein
MSTVRIQVRRGLASEWTTANPVLAAGEMGVETNTNLFKFGNGSSTWTALSYANNSDVAIGEISQDAINTALTMGAGLTKTYNDGANTITITVDTAVVSTKAFATSEAAAAQTAAATDATTKVAAEAALRASGDTAAIAAAATYTDSAVNGVNSSLSGYLETGDRGIAGGVASLDSNVKVPQAQLSLGNLTTNVTTSANMNAANITAENMTSNTLLTANNVTISGNLTVNGTATTVNSTNVTIDDPMIYIGDGNQSNALDLGVVAAFNNGTYQHAGLVRDASDNGIWKLFSGVTAEPGTTVDFTTYTKDKLEVGTLYADAAIIGSVSNADLQNVAGVTSPIQTQLNNKLEVVADSHITAPRIADGAVITAKIADSAVTSAKLADGSVTTAKIGNAAVTAAKIENAAVGASALASDSVETAKIMNLAVTSAKLAVDAVATANIADGAVTTAELGAAAVTAAKIVDGGVTNDKIADVTITNAKISATAAIDQSKVAGLTEALATKATIDSPTFTGAVVLPATTTIGTVDSTEMGYLNGVTSSVQTQLTAGATALAAHEADTTNIHGIADTSVLATATTVATAKSEAITAAGTAADTKVSTAVAALTKSSVGLGNVDNTADASKPVSTAQATAIATAKSEAIASATASVNAVIASAPAALDTLNELATALGNDASFATTMTNALAAKAPIASPTFTGTVTVAAAGVAFADKTQTKAGVPSLTAIAGTQSASTTLDALGTDAAVRDSLVPLSGAVNISFEATGNAKYAIGSSISFYQSAGTGANITGNTITILATPGATLRTTNSSVTATKVAATTWLLAGDLRA